MKNEENKKSFFDTICNSRYLIHQSLKRDIEGKYKGTSIGVFWSIATPLLTIIVYTFVFSEIFQSKWNLVSHGKAEYALVLYIGLIVFNFFSDCISRAPLAVVSNPNYVKKIVFPLELLPLINMLSALYNAFVCFCVWLLIYFILNGVPPVTVILFPVVLLPICLTSIGLSWILSALGVYFRDMANFVSLSLVVCMFLSPIFYPVTSVPSPYRIWMYLNPLTTTIESLRDVMYFEKPIDYGLFAISILFSYLVAVGGYFFFMKTKSGFADVI